MKQYEPLTLNLYKDIAKDGTLHKTNVKRSDLSQFYHAGSVILNDLGMLQGIDIYWGLKDSQTMDMKLSF